MSSYKCFPLFRSTLNRNTFNGIANSCVIARNTNKLVSTYNQDTITAHDTALPYDKIPGPSTLPVIGCLHHFVLGGRYKDLGFLHLAEKLYHDYGDIVRLAGLPGKPDMVFLYDLDDIEKVYRTEGPWPMRSGLDTREYYLKEKRSEIFKSVIGLVHSQGQEWQDIRSKVNQPMMQLKITKQYVGWIEEIANDFILRMRTLLDAEGNVPQNFLIEIDRWSLESIARIAIDTRLGCLNSDLQEGSDAMKLIKSLQRFFDLGFELEFLPSYWKYVTTPKYKELMQIYDCFTDITIKYISQAIKRMEANPSADVKNLSILEKLLKIDPQVAIIMALDMFFAGVDTTASNVITTLYFLATNPEKQARLRKELKTVFPRGNDITSEGLNSLSYLKACLKETQRLMPVAAANSRMTGVDLVLQGYTIPKGTSLLLNNHLASKFKNQYPQQSSYIPERWLRSDTEGAPPAKNAHKFAYMPFGFGPRMCVGRRFAELEMEVFISRMISEFQVDWCGPAMKFKSSLITGPTGPMRFKLTSIK